MWDREWPNLHIMTEVSQVACSYQLKGQNSLQGWVPDLGKGKRTFVRPHRLGIEKSKSRETSAFNTTSSEGWSPAGIQPYAPSLPPSLLGSCLWTLCFDIARSALVLRDAGLQKMHLRAASEQQWHQEPQPRRRSHGSQHCTNTSREKAIEQLLTFWNTSHLPHCFPSACSGDNQMSCAIYGGEHLQSLWLFHLRAQSPYPYWARHRFPSTF